MQDYQEAMVKSLIAVAWADGKVEDEETEVIDALISAFELEGADADAIREFAKTPRTLDEIPLTELSLHDRRMLLQHAVIVTFIDGDQSAEELALLDDLQNRLHLEEAEAKELREMATSRAQRLLQLM
ncbi:MAG: TerB family tellurite resistance protein [Sandaracinaceae bacterium]|jgi:tellurite resistance protein|nr:TerB family tellurite resistance protein [Sandaracinaceae bacterium]MBP7685247.1 TerB family tellurite resistance protein [Deltaproteobacteria bacterium]MBK6811287.1 TerB family tellurite resistance protein [Sandaracinaceae bacterium]MBK7151137.1 TerB family tellurite resistance protein [Sandaracinaceae bacterium]MBK7776644.1 TerB family tellurite resistance protein [Sandaracinaceae bacterium]